MLLNRAKRRLLLSRRSFIAGSLATLAAPALAFNMNGVSQRGVDLFLRSEGTLGSDSYTLSGLSSVNPAAISGDVLNIVFIGQSTNNNSIGASLTPYPLVNPTKVFMGSIANPVANTVMFAAKEPLLCSDLTNGHHGMPLADTLISDGAIANVALWMIAFGGSYTGNWVPGGGPSGIGGQPDYLSWRIGLVARAIYNAGLWNKRTVIDFQHGEWDTDAATSATDMRGNIVAIANVAKYWGLLRTGNVMFVHLNTRISDPTAARNAIRLGEVNACDGVLIRLGADIDTLPATPYRYDGTHFNFSPGSPAQAALKKPFYESFLANG